MITNTFKSKFTINNTETLSSKITSDNLSRQCEIIYGKEKELLKDDSKET